MARTFTTGNYLKRTSPSDIGGSGTIMFRFKPTWSSGDSSYRIMWGYNSASGNNMLLYMHYLDNNMYIGWYAGSDTRISVSDSGFFSSGTWATHIFDWDDTADLQHVYVDNTLKGTGSGSFTAFGSHSALVVGASPAVGFASLNEGDQPAAGDIAEWARWDRVLTADERTVLQATGCPLSVPRGLVRYIPTIGQYSPEIDVTGGESLTVTGTPSAAAHPRTFLPYADALYHVATAVAYTLTAAAGAFTLSGQSVNLLAGRKVTAEAGAFTLSGQSVTLKAARVLSAAAGSFALTGQDVALKAARLLTAAVGTFTHTGQDVGLYYGRKIAAAVGSFVLSGQAVTLKAARRIAAAVGEFILTGQAVALNYSGFVFAPGIRLTTSNSAVLTCTASDSAVLRLTISDGLSTGAQI